MGIILSLMVEQHPCNLRSKMIKLKKYGFNTDNLAFVIAEIGINHEGSFKKHYY